MIKSARVARLVATPYRRAFNRIHVDSDDNRFVYRYLEVDTDTFYLGYTAAGDQARFFVSNNSRYGTTDNHHVVLPMVNGDEHTLNGPWPSRPAVINEVFKIEDPLVECVQDHILTYVPKSVLERLGVELVAVRSFGEIDWRAK